MRPAYEPFEPAEGLLQCKYCGGYHPFLCPFIATIEFYEGGIAVKRIEFRREHRRLIKFIERDGE